MFSNLYKKRIALPVFEYQADFMRLLSQHQCIVLVARGSLLRSPSKYLHIYIYTYINYIFSRSFNLY